MTILENGARTVTPQETTKYNYKEISERITNYKNNGMAVIPVNYQEKATSLKGWTERSSEDCNLQEFVNQKNVGIVLGDNSNGLVDIDLDCPEAIKLAPYFLPETGCIFGHSHKPKSHWVYNAGQGFKSEKFTAVGKTLLEIRSNGSYTVFPPSHHPTGGKIEFQNDAEPKHVNYDDLKRASKKLAAATILLTEWCTGTRNALTMALSGLLRKTSQWTEAEVTDFIKIIAENANDDELDSRIRSIHETFNKPESLIIGFKGLEEILGFDVATKVSEWLTGQSNNNAVTNIHDIAMEASKKMTDVGNGLRFYEQHHHKARYVTDIGQWMTWNKSKWDMDSDASVRRMAHETANSLYAEVGNPMGISREDAFKWAKSSNSTARVNSMMIEAQPYLGIESDELDKHGWLLNCKNGIVDLETGALQPHNPDYFLTQYCNTAFNPDAKCPSFKAFLQQIFASDASLIGFVQRALGGSMAGRDIRRHLFIAYGTGSNGKSTLLEVIESALGEYVATTPAQTLIQNKGRSGSIENDIARLRGVRLVKTSELEKGQQLAEAKVKQMTGGDKVTARFLRKEYFEFTPVCDFWMSTNEKPKITGTDQAIWNRVFLIPFEVVIPDDQKDPDLKNKLLQEKEGILAWLVEGCLKWQSEGLNPPEKVKAATDEYQNQSDTVAQFVNDCVEEQFDGCVTKDDLFQHYWHWCRDNGHDPLTKNDFGADFASRGYKDSSKRPIGRYWKQITLIGKDYDPHLGVSFDKE